MQSNNSEFVVFTGNANPGMAEEIAKHLGTSLALPMLVVFLTVK